jgi:hypothetical protein
MEQSGVSYIYNFFKNKIEIYSSDSVNFDFIDSGSYKTDSIGAPNSVDQNDEKCTIVLRQFNEVYDKEAERIILVYPDNRSLIFKLKENE